MVIIALLFVPWQLSKGNLYNSSLIIIASITLLILTICWANQGVRDEILLAFPALITFAVITDTTKILNKLAVFIVINILLMGWFHSIGIVNHASIGNGVIEAILVSVIFVTVYLSIRLLGTDLTKANKDLTSHQSTLEENIVIRTKELSNTVEALKNAQSELIEAEKMISLGKLVAGVAHEINTPIGVSVTAASIIKDSTEEINLQLQKNEITKSALISCMNRIGGSSEILSTNLQRASELIADFKETAVAKSDEQKTELNLPSYIQQVINSLRPDDVDQHIKVSVEQGIDYQVFQDEAAISRIITNLYNNSVRHGFEAREFGEITIEFEDHNEFVKVIFSDNGRGISEEVLPNIFEPFFTTKRGKGGTGLGMHLVYNLVTQCLDGSIVCQSDGITGTRFEIMIRK